MDTEREKLFTFLSHDGVPWNNNNAEHAIKAFARLHRTVEGLSTPKGIEEYLILLSVCQTCKYSGLDFLGFLRSGETDINTFAASQRNRSGFIVKNTAGLARLARKELAKLDCQCRLALGMVEAP